MVFEHIEKLKREYTDKYVVVDETRPELRRFRSQTGIVKTVNMNGRALVEFGAHQNVGWYDIDLSHLRVVEAPLPAEPAKKQRAAAEGAAAKPEAAKPAAASVQTAKGSGQGAGMSVADVLAAARGGAAAAGGDQPGAARKAKSPAPAETTAKAAPADKPSQPKVDSKKMSVADILAAARGQAGSPPAVEGGASALPATAAKPAAAKADPAKMTVEEILAAARGQAGASAASKSDEGSSAPTAPAAPAAKPPAAKLDPKTMSVAEILAAARSQGDAPAAAPAAAHVASQSPRERSAPAAEVRESADVAPTASEPETAVSQEGPLPTSTAEIIAYCRKRDG